MSGPKRSRPVFPMWALLHAKVTLILWASVSVANPSQVFIREIGGATYYTMLGFVIFGCTVAIIGLMMTRSFNPKTRYQGLIIELSGLFFAIVGPLSMCITLAITSFNDEENNITTITFIYAYVALLLVRIRTVQRALRRSGFV